MNIKPYLCALWAISPIFTASAALNPEADHNSNTTYTVYPYYEDFASSDSELNKTYASHIDTADAVFVGRVSSIQTQFPALSLANRCFAKFDSIQWLKQPASYPADNLSEIAYYPYRKPDDATTLKDFKDAANCPLKAGTQYLIFAAFDPTAPEGLKHLHIDMREGTTQPYEDAQHKILAIQSHLKK